MFISQQYFPVDHKGHSDHCGVSWYFRLASIRRARRYDDVKAFYNL